MNPPATASHRVLLHLENGRRVPIDLAEVFFLEAGGDQTEVRTRGRRRLRDLRSLAEVMARFPAGSLVQVHRRYAVNIDRVDEIRRRDGGRDWELKLEPPVNRVLPVSRTYLPRLWVSYGEG